MMGHEEVRDAAVPREPNGEQGHKSASGKSVVRPSYLRGGRPGSIEPVIATQEKPVEAVEAKTVSEDKVLCQWKIWLFPRRPTVSAVVSIVIIGSLGLAYWTYPNALFISLIALLLVNRLAMYLFPVKYTIGEETVGYVTFLAKDKRTWDQFVTYYQFPDGVLLTHDQRGFRGRLKEGLFLYYHRDLSNKEQILDLVKTKLKPPKEVAREEPDPKKGGLLSAWRRARRAKKGPGQDE